jgi:hypothetical protein
MHTKHLSVNLKVRDHFVDLGLDNGIILKSILEIQDVDWDGSVRLSPIASFCEHDNEPLLSL